MEQAVSFMIGITALVIGFSFLIRGKSWSEYLKRVRRGGQPVALMIGYLHLLAGTFILGFHWEWKGLPMLLTLLGVKAAAEGITYTFFPNAMLAMLAWYVPRRHVFFPIAGIVTMIIGTLVLNEWWRYMQSDACIWHPCFNQAWRQ